MYRSFLPVILFLFTAAIAVAQDKKGSSGFFRQNRDTVVIYSKAYKDSVARKRKKDASRRDTVIIVPATKLIKKDTAVRKQVAAQTKQPQGIQGVMPNVPLTISIAMRQAVVRNIYELKISMIVTNKGYRTQSFLFDRPMRASGGMWAASCTIFDASERSVLKLTYNNTPERRSFTGRELEKFWYTLKPGEWLMKSFDVTGLVSFEEQFEKTGKLPPGKYYLQVNFQNNPSNIVSFTMR